MYIVYFKPTPDTPDTPDSDAETCLSEVERIISKFLLHLSTRLDDFTFCTYRH